MDGTVYGSLANAIDDLDQKEVQRALFMRAVGLSPRESSDIKGGISPLVNRIMWGDVASVPIAGTTRTPDYNIFNSAVPRFSYDISGKEKNDGDFARVVWANVLVSSALVKEVGGEPTKYECSLEAAIIGLGSSTKPF